MSTPQRITQRHDAAYRRRELIDNPCFLRENAESLLRAYRRKQRQVARFWIAAAAGFFSVAAWLGVAWLTRHLLP